MRLRINLSLPGFFMKSDLPAIDRVDFYFAHDFNISDSLFQFEIFIEQIPETDVILQVRQLWVSF